MTWPPMTSSAQDFARDLGAHAEEMPKSVLEALAEIPGATGADIRALAVAVFRKRGTANRPIPPGNPDDDYNEWLAYYSVHVAINAVLHMGPEGWLPNLIKAMDRCDPEVVGEVHRLMQALKKARRALEDREREEREKNAAALI